jgi:hypothetical protein
MNELEKQLRDLNEKHWNLTLDLHAERHPRKKEKIQEQKDFVYKQIQELKEKIEEQKNKEALPQTDAVIKENRQTFYLGMNGVRIPIPENLELELKYEPCGHKKKMPLREILRKFDYHNDRNFPEPNTYLLQRWEGVFQRNETYHPAFNCEQCRKEADDLLTKMHIRKGNAVVGVCRLVVRTLQ